MTTLTPFLRALVFLFILHPVFLGGWGVWVFGSTFIKSSRLTGVLGLLFQVIGHAVILAVVFTLQPQLWLLTPPRNPVFYGIALLGAPLALVAEGRLLRFILQLKTGQRVRETRLHSQWNRTPLFTYGAALLLALFEELLFRMAWFNLLAFRFSPLVILLGSSLAYGFNHTYFGWQVVVAKVLSGLFYGGLYLLSGEAILIPIITHLSQNILTLLWGRRKAKAYSPQGQSFF